MAARSNPKGMLLAFEASSPRPITRILFDLVEDGEPGLAVNFEGRQRGEPDGRYFRQVAFKPVVNGTWTLRITAWNDLGCSGQSNDSQKVQVVF